MFDEFSFCNYYLQIYSSNINFANKISFWKRFLGQVLPIWQLSGKVEANR
jgi:hypothetical protein